MALDEICVGSWRVLSVKSLAKDEEMDVSTYVHINSRFLGRASEIVLVFVGGGAVLLWYRRHYSNVGFDYPR